MVRAKATRSTISTKMRIGARKIAKKLLEK